VRGRESLVPALVAALVAAAGCGAADAKTEALRAFPGSVPSLDSLGRGVVSGFVRNDSARVKGYTLSLEEYRDVVWPRLQVDTTTGWGFDWSWRDNQLRGERAYRRYMSWMKGVPLTAVETRCAEAPQRFEGVTLVAGCTVVVRDSTGATEEMRLFRSAVIVGGGYKIFRYDD